MLSFEDQVIAHIDVERALAKLSEKDRHVIERRYGFDGSDTFKDIGKEMGVTLERVRQREARALDRLREVFKGGPASVSALYYIALDVKAKKYRNRSAPYTPPPKVDLKPIPKWDGPRIPVPPMTGRIYTTGGATAGDVRVRDGKCHITIMTRDETYDITGDKPLLTTDDVSERLKELGLRWCC